ncbi:ABC transporter substrate-binding protein [Brevibacterium sp. 91QC2O2]|uniref:ABC transporter substrate-binding protein n=1 Tax=Brevibacterium sp. 91QC2O2 TaxID=2968458 RepID=UPI00211D0DEA|nr:ABC transporter substrate-binding protein [Brevibacterium sp. 91QC2O2]
MSIRVFKPRPDGHRPRRRTRRLAAALAAGTSALALVLTGCSLGAAPEGDTVRARFSADPTTFDPALLTAGDDYYAARMLYDTLLRYDDKGKIVGGLAQDWKIGSKGGTVTLRDGATCSDGTPIDADVVVKSLQRFVDPATKSAMKSLSFGSGDVTVSKKDAKTVDIKVSEPFGEIEPGLTVIGSGIVCPAGLADLKGLKAGTVDGAFSGPYSVTEAKPGINYRFKLNADYAAWPKFAADLPGRVPGTLDFSVGADTSTNANEILGGSLDLGVISPTDTDRFQNVATIIIGEQYVVFNQADTSPFKDEKLRKAVGQVLLNKNYNQIAYAGKSDDQLTVGDKNMQCANTDASLLQQYDPQAVKDSGVLKGVKMKYAASNSFGPGGIGAEYIYQELENAGADVDYALTDNATWASLVLGPESDTWDITLFGTVNQTVTLWTSVSRLMGVPIEDGGRSMTRAKNPEGEKLVTEVMTSDDAESKCQAYQKLQANFLGRADVVPLSGSATFYASRAGVEYLTPNNRQDFTTIRITD